jgi:hypothetical protein
LKGKYWIQSIEKLWLELFSMQLQHIFGQLPQISGRLPDY